MATCSLFATDHQWQVAHRQYKFWSRRWLRSLKVRAMQRINVKNSDHDFSVKLSSCICSHIDSSCPGCWLMWYLDICLYMTSPALWDYKLGSQCAALSGSPVMINHHTSYICCIDFWLDFVQLLYTIVISAFIAERLSVRQQYNLAMRCMYVCRSRFGMQS